MPKPVVIAIVDDDEAVREAILDLLQVEGLAARTFSGAVPFLDADGTDFACVITDVRMPEVDGLELQRRLRALGSTVPVIFITSSTDPGIRDRAIEEGAAAWFSKPVADAALLSTLRAALDSWAADDASA